jgi:hypothetical protein
MSNLEFSTTTASGDTFEEIDPRRLSDAPGFADAVEAGLADRQRTHTLLAALRLAAGITQDEAAAAWVAHNHMCHASNGSISASLR